MRWFAREDATKGEKAAREINADQKRERLRRKKREKDNNSRAQKFEQKLEFAIEKRQQHARLQKKQEKALSIFVSMLKQRDCKTVQLFHSNFLMCVGCCKVCQTDGALYALAAMLAPSRARSLISAVIANNKIKII